MKSVNEGTRFADFETEEIRALLLGLAEQEAKAPVDALYDEMSREIKVRADEGEPEAGDLYWNGPPCLYVPEENDES